MSERPKDESMPSASAQDNSLNGRFGMKSEPVNYSICNAVRIADTKSIILVMQIRYDKLILLFPKSNRTSIEHTTTFLASEAFIGQFKAILISSHKLGIHGPGRTSQGL